MNFLRLDKSKIYLIKEKPQKKWRKLIDEKNKKYKKNNLNKNHMNENFLTFKTPYSIIKYRYGQ